MDLFVFPVKVEGMYEFSCDIFPKCPGCFLQKKVNTPPVWSLLKEFFGSAVVDEPVFLTALGWRSKVKLAVRGVKGNLSMGLFARDSHDVVKMESCPLHDPVLNEALCFLYFALHKWGIVPYEERSGAGRLRYIQMHVQKHTQKIQFCFMINGDSIGKEERLCFEELSSKSFCHSIWVNFVSGFTNSILGEEFVLLFGEEFFFQEILGIPYFFHPASFAQANLPVFSLMLEEIAAVVAPEKKVVELYAGVGCIGVYLGQKSTQTVLVESSPLSLKMFQKTKEKGFGKLCRFFQEKVESFSSFDDVDVFVVDPPRKGLSLVCKKKIEDSNAHQLVYVSCGPESLIRDAKEFLSKGWFITRAKGFILFPGANHVEMVVCFERKGRLADKK